MASKSGLLLLLLLSLVALLFSGCTSDDGGGDGGVGSDAPESLTVSSSAFDDGAAIPRKHTCDGSNVKPPLSVGEVPGEAAALVLIMDDPDAPRGTFLHYTVWNLPADQVSWADGADLRARGGVEGANGRGEPGYIGPCPPEDDGPHRYFFRVYALDRTLDLEAGASRASLESAMEGHVVARGTLMGTYERAASE